MANAAAVEEQSSVTGEICENIAQASGGIEEVNINLNESFAAAGKMTQQIGGINDASRDIAVERAGTEERERSFLSRL